MAHLTIGTRRSPMTQWPIQRNVFTLIPQASLMNKSTQQETTHILTAHNTNAPRLTSTHHHCQNYHHQTSQSSTPNAYDDSLTNLSWLHDINILKRTMPTINTSGSTTAAAAATTTNKRKEHSSPSPSSSSGSTVYPNDIISDHGDLTVNNDIDDDDDNRWRMYKNNPQAKPVYSYSQLILLAMKQSGHEKMTLQMIYEWVAENFPYFKKMEPTWQNSIRHNLSLNKYFVKVPRTKKEAGAGKGGFWKLSSEYERQRSLLNASKQQKTSITPPQQQNVNAVIQTKRLRQSKRSTSTVSTAETSSLNQILSDNVTPLIKTNSSRLSQTTIKTEAWIDPILPCIVSKNQSPIHCQTMALDRTFVRMPSSFLSPTSSPDPLTISPFHSQAMSDLSAILTPSPSNSPSSMSSTNSKQNLNGTKFDDSDMLLLDPSNFDWDAYLCETPNDMDVQPLLVTKTEQDLLNDFDAAITDLASSAAAGAVSGSDVDATNAFDPFEYATRHSNFHSLFDDDDSQQQQHSEQTIQSLTTFDDLSVKGFGIRRPPWWMNNETLSSTKLPSLEAAFDLKLSK